MSKPMDDSLINSRERRSSSSGDSIADLHLQRNSAKQKMRDAIHRDYDDMKESFELIDYLYHLKQENPEEYLDFSAAKPLSKATKTIRAIDISIYKDINWGETPKVHRFLRNSLKRYFDSCSIPSSDHNRVIAVNSIFTLIPKCYEALRKDHPKGFEVLIPAPTFGYYVHQCESKGIASKLIDTSETSYRLTPEQLEKAIINSSKSVVFLFTNPVNPTGIVYTEKEIKELSDVLKKFNDKVILAISDEIFKDVIMDENISAQGSFCSLGSQYENTVTCNGLSKAYGYESVGSFAIGPKEIIKQIEAPDFKLSDSAQIKISLSLVRSKEDASSLIEDLSKTYGFDKFRFRYEDRSGMILEPLKGFKLSETELSLLKEYKIKVDLITSKVHELSDEDTAIIHDYNELEQKRILLQNGYDKLNAADQKRNDEYEALSLDDKEQKYNESLEKFSDENLEYFVRNLQKCKAKITLVKSSINSLNEKLQTQFEEIEIKAAIESPQAASMLLIDFSSLKGASLHKAGENDESNQTFKLNNDLDNDLDIVKFLAKEAKVIMMPGKSYGIDSNKMIVRMSVSHKDDKIQSAFKAIENAISRSLTMDHSQARSQSSSPYMPVFSEDDEIKNDGSPSSSACKPTQTALISTPKSPQLPTHTQ